MILIRPFILALQFLTIIPAGSSHKPSDKEISASVPWFPVVGLLIGLIVQILYKVFLSFFSIGLSDCLAIFSMVILNGGLHLDGLADLFDGLGSRRNREDTLTVMRDSRLGSIGALALVTVLLLKIFAFREVNSDHKYLVLLLMPVMGRWIQVYLLSFGTYARSEGLASPYFQTNKVSFVLAGLIPVFLFLQEFKLQGVLMIFIIFSLFYLYILWLHRRLGGQTGDTIGAGSELAELLLVFVILIFTKMGWIWQTWL